MTSLLISVRVVGKNLLVLPVDHLGHSQVAGLDDVELVARITLFDDYLPSSDVSLSHGIDDDRQILLVETHEHERAAEDARDLRLRFLVLLDDFGHEGCLDVVLAENFRTDGSAGTLRHLDLILMLHWAQAIVHFIEFFAL